MTRHLNDAEFVDWLEGILPAERSAHLDRCAACHHRAEAVRATLEDLRTPEPSDLPEPSPLFWEHFSRRVHDAVAEQPPVRRSKWIGAWAPLAAVLVLCAAVALIWTQTRSDGDRDPAVSGVGIARVVTSDPDAIDLEDDAEWGLVRIAADDLDWDTAADAGLQPNPGSAEGIATQMSIAERRELGRLIEAEMKNRGV